MYVHSIGLIGTSIVMTLFAVSVPLFDIDHPSDSSHSWIFLFLWTCNGFTQSMCWPTAVKIMGNWIDSKNSGKIMGAWSSTAMIGNIIGAFIVSIIGEIARRRAGREARNAILTQSFVRINALLSCVCTYATLCFNAFVPIEFGNHNS